jgi:hypothetical protein
MSPPQVVKYTIIGIRYDNETNKMELKLEGVVNMVQPILMMLDAIQMIVTGQVKVNIILPSGSN